MFWMWHVVNLSPLIIFFIFSLFFTVKTGLSWSTPTALFNFDFAHVLFGSFSNEEFFFSKIKSDNFRQIEVKGQTRSFFYFFGKMFQYGHVAYQKLRIEERFKVMSFFCLYVDQFSRYCSWSDLDMGSWVIVRQICTCIHTIFSFGVKSTKIFTNESDDILKKIEI